MFVCTNVRNSWKVLCFPRPGLPAPPRRHPPPGGGRARGPEVSSRGPTGRRQEQGPSPPRPQPLPAVPVTPRTRRYARRDRGLDLSVHMAPCDALSRDPPANNTNRIRPGLTEQPKHKSAKLQKFKPLPPTPSTRPGNVESSGSNDNFPLKFPKLQILGVFLNWCCADAKRATCDNQKSPRYAFTSWKPNERPNIVVPLVQW